MKTCLSGRRRRHAHRIRPTGGISGRVAPLDPANDPAAAYLTESRPSTRPTTHRRHIWPSRGDTAPTPAASSRGSARRGSAAARPPRRRLGDGRHRRAAPLRQREVRAQVGERAEAADRAGRAAGVPAVADELDVERVHLVRRQDLLEQVVGALERRVAAGACPAASATRWTWVSTGIAGRPKANRSTIEAVLRPIPGSPTSHSRASSSGHSPEEAQVPGPVGRVVHLGQDVLDAASTWSGARPPGRMTSSSSSVGAASTASQDG